MAYEFLNLKDGDVLTSEHIDHLENGIRELSETAEYMKETMVNILGDKDVAASTDEELSEILRKFTYLKNPDVKEYDGYTADLIDIKSGIESGTIRMVVTDQNTVGFKVMATNGFTVDWGDGTTNTYSSTSLTEVSHTYTKGTGEYYNGTYTQFMITIYPNDGGVIKQYKAHFDNGDSAKKYPILAFSAKDIYFNNMESMFAYHKNLKYIDIIGGSLGVNELNASMSYFCNQCNNLKYINANVCWSSITNIENGFNSCYVLEELNLGDTWNTINCTTFSQTFFGCKLLKEIPYLITSSATNLTAMCCDCNSLEIIHGDTWDLSNCITLSRTFEACKSLITLPYLANTGNVTNSDSCFKNCNSLKKLHDKQLSLDVSSVTYASTMFYNCTSLEELPELNFDNATNVRSLCYGCSSLYIVQSFFNLPKVGGSAHQNTNPESTHNSMECMFYNCTSLTNAPEIYAPNAVVVAGLFCNCSNLVNVPESYSFPSCLNAKQMFYGCTLMQTAPRILDLPKVQNVEAMFENCTSLKIAPAPNEGDSFEFPEVLSASTMFKNCSSMQTAPVELKLPKATNVSGIFSGCSSMQTAPKVIEFGSATDIQQLFRYCSSLQYPPNSISAPLATNASYLFDCCESLLVCPELDLPVCTNLSYCFSSCKALTSTIPYHFSKVNNIDRFYSGCNSLTFIEPITSDATSLKVDSFAQGCNGLISVAAPVCINGHLNSAANNVGVMWNTSGSSHPMKTITNAIDVFSMSYELSNQILGSSYLENVTLSGLKAALTLNNKPYLTSFRLENPQSSMANLTITNCALDTDAINQLFEDLPTVTTTRTINIKGNPGAETCDRSIATVKNWTVVYI